MGDWRQKLNKSEKKHLRETGATTKGAFLRNREAQRQSTPDACFECRHIALKLGLES